MCPDFDDFCEYVPVKCSTYCSRNGVCVNGTCECANGYGGSDCSQNLNVTCDPSCVTCSGIGPNSCLTCD